MSGAGARDPGAAPIRIFVDPFGMRAGDAHCGSALFSRLFFQGIPGGKQTPEAPAGGGGRREHRPENPIHLRGELGLDLHRLGFRPGMLSTGTWSWECPAGEEKDPGNPNLG